MDDGRKIIMLAAGFRYGEEGSDDDRCHTFGADTNAEIRREMKRVAPCNCQACRTALMGTGKLWS